MVASAGSAVTFTTHSSFGKMSTFAAGKSLMLLANHDGFVQTLFEKEPEDTDS